MRHTLDVLRCLEAGFSGLTDPADHNGAVRGGAHGGHCRPLRCGLAACAAGTLQCASRASKGHYKPGTATKNRERSLNTGNNRQKPGTITKNRERSLKIWKFNSLCSRRTHQHQHTKKHIQRERECVCVRACGYAHTHVHARAREAEQTRQRSGCRSGTHARTHPRTGACARAHTHTHTHFEKYSTTGVAECKSSSVGSSNKRHCATPMGALLWGQVHSSA